MVLLDDCPWILNLTTNIYTNNYINYIQANAAGIACSTLLDD
jgi:hypothetical protein